MADQKISELTELAEAPASNDVLVIVDTSATSTKKIQASNLRANLAASGANTDITSIYLNNTGLKIKDTNASHGLSLVPGSDLSADRVLTLTTGDSDRTLSLSANFTLPADPNADRILFWDDSEGLTAYLSLGNGLTITTTSIAVDSASDTVDGIVELATAAETTTGTDATRAVTPDGLAGSDYGKRVVGIMVVAPGTDTATGDGKAFFRVPSVMNGWNLVGVAMSVYTAGTTNTTDVQIRNITQAADMLTTKLTIDSTETDTSTAATPAVIDTANDDVATGDRIAIDVDAISTTAAKGLYVELIFQLP